MLRFFSFVFFSCFFLSAVAQYDGELYAYGKNWVPESDIFKAQFIMNLVKENDSTYVCRYYHKKGPMIKWETYRDSSLEMPNGLFAWYNNKGTVDSVGEVYNGKKNKEWTYNLVTNDGKYYVLTSIYHMGVLLKKIDHHTNIITYANGDTATYYPAEYTVADTLTHKPAAFENGIKGWTKYVEKTLKVPDRFKELFPRDTKAPVRVSFIVDTAGITSHFFIDQSFEWSVDMETIRVIKSSPAWKPASINGERVIYRHRQTITFVN